MEADMAEIGDAVTLEMTDFMTYSADGVLLLLGVVMVEVMQWGEDRWAG